MRKSCLFQLVLFTVLVFVVAMFLRGYIRSCRGAEGAATLSGRLQREEGGGGSITSQEEEVEESVESTKARATGIEGLSRLPVSRLMIDAPRVRGLAVSKDFFYVSSFDPSRQVGSLYQVKQENRSISQVRALQEDGRYRMGGLSLSGDSLLTSLVGDEADSGSSILFLDARHLEIQSRFHVDARIRAVAQGADDLVYGFDSDAATFYAWTPEGEEVRKKASYEGVQYGDMEFVQGSLVCSGVENGSGIIDVVDPGTFTLLVRHRCYTRTPDQEWVTSKGFAFFNGVFYFVPDDGHFPTLMRYVLDDVTLSEYIPSVGRGSPMGETQ